MSERRIKFFQAINEALDVCLERDPGVYVMGLGVPDPKGVFGTTLGLQRKYGAERVMDMPTAENGMTGVAIGSALTGLRPVMVHQRLDFALLAIEQIVNQAAKWHYMFGGQMSVPLVVRLVVGRGWGQGPQHSQNLQAWFAHVPGLKVVTPATPYDAKGLLIASIEDNNPVIFIEHRWLHNVEGEVPEAWYRVEMGKATRVVEGRDLTIVANAFMTLEAIEAAKHLAKIGVAAEVIDLRALRPLDEETILASVRKTGRLLVAEEAWKTGGFGAEIVARVVEKEMKSLRAAPARIALPDTPTPTSPALAARYYPRVANIVHEAQKMLGRTFERLEEIPSDGIGLDIPDLSFRGPF